MKLKAKKYTVRNIVPTLIAMSPGTMGVSLILNLMLGVMPTLQALGLAWFVDSAIEFVKGARTAAQLILPVACMFGAQLLAFTRNELDGTCTRLLAANILEQFRPLVTRKAASLEYRLIEDEKAWDLIHRMTQNPNEKLYFLLDGLVYLLQVGVTAAGVLALVAAQVWWAALALALSFIPVVWMTVKMGEKQYQIKAEVTGKDRRFKALRNIDMGREYSEERAMFGYGEYVTQEFEQEFVPAYKQVFRLRRFMCGASIASDTVSMTLILVCCCVLAVPVVRGEVSVGLLVGLLTQLFELSRILNGINFSTRMVGEGKGFLKDLTEFSMLPETEGALDKPAEEAEPFRSLEFRHVTFAYPGAERKVLDDFSLTLEAGKHYAFVGVNGAGKTTMTKLLCGLYDSFEGEILLNGKDIRTYSAPQLKALITPVFQDFARYQVPMRESITLGDERCEERLDEVVDAIGLREAVDALEKGLDTPLGKIYEGGQDLSGGQWQRVAIARALVRSAPVRILDEPTAALDPISESNFYERFGELSRGVTTLFISHRLGSTRLADRIFVMDGGRIAEEGTQRELLERGGLYARMFEAQRSWYQ